MKFPKVSIIIVNWNRLNDTLECIESVLKLDYPNFEVIIVDNGSTDESVPVIRKVYPKVILIENKENLGYTGGNNIGMNYAVQNSTAYIWLLNNDTIVEATTLSRLVEIGEGSSKVGIISPVIYYYDNPQKIQFCGSYADWADHKIVYPQDRTLYVHNDFIKGENVCLWGTALLIKTEAVNRIGYLNDKFYAYWEDTEYSIRSNKAGFRNELALNAKIYHKTYKERQPYYYYFMARNEYYTWLQHVSDAEKTAFARKYLAKKIAEYGLLKKSGFDEYAHACLDGTWAAFHGVDGTWNRTVKTPRMIQQVFSWHPFFWASLVAGDVSNIFAETVKRIKLKYTNRNVNR